MLLVYNTTFAIHEIVWLQTAGGQSSPAQTGSDRSSTVSWVTLPGTGCYCYIRIQPGGDWAFWCEDAQALHEQYKKKFPYVLSGRPCSRALSVFLPG